MSQTKAQLLDPVDLSIVTADLADDAVTTDKLASNAVVNASVDASAAIQGTKISPDFGSQVITTTGNASVGETLTITGNDPNITFVDSNNNPDYKIFANAGTLNFFDSTNNQSRILINTDGHIDLVGNVDALNGLDVTGNVTTTGSITITSAAPNLLFTESDANPDFGVLLSGGQLKFQDVTNTNNILTLDSNKIQAVTNLDALAGLDVTGNIVGTADLTIDTDSLKVDSSNGRVGIGDASPSTVLHIKTSNPDVYLENTGTGTGQLRIGHFTNSAFIGTYNDDGGNSDALRLGTHSGNERMRITSDGKVGIGTSSPTDVLSVVGDINLMDNGTIYGGDDAANTLILRSASGNANHSRIDVGVSEGSDNGGIHFYTAGSSAATRRITIKGTSGNVGIGTTTPERQLHVLHSTGDALVRITSADGGAAYIELGDASDGDAGKIVYDNGDNLTFSTANSGTTTEKLRIQGNGIVGIGTTAPEGKGLDVTVSRTNGYAAGTDTRNLANIICRNSSDGAGRFAALSFINGGGTQAEGSINLVQTGNYNGDLTFKIRTAVSTWAERMRLVSSGEVGFGTTTPPTGCVHVHLTETPEFNLFSTQHAQNNNCKINFGVGESASVSGNTGGRIEMNIPNAGGAMTGELKFFTNSGDNLQERMRILSGGGITFNGDTATANALDDYEEGTWNPDPDDGNNVFTHGQEQGRYIKIGNVVHCTFRINVSLSGTSGFAMFMTGLPFTVKDFSEETNEGISTAKGTGQEAQLEAQQGQTKFKYRNPSSGAAMSVNDVGCVNNVVKSLRGAITYITT